MPYVSELQGRPVADVEGERIGLLQDVIATLQQGMVRPVIRAIVVKRAAGTLVAVSYTHLRAHETVLDLVCRLLLEKKKDKAV